MTDYRMKFGGNMKTLNKLALLLVGLLLSVSAGAAGLSSARAVAMGGAHIGLAKGVYASLYNPANLGFASHRETGLEIAGAGVELENNSFTLKDYNKYTGAVLSDDDKSVILGKIPAEGLKIAAEAEAGAMSMAKGPFALSITGRAATVANLGKDALELFLNGNGLNDTFSVDGMYSDAFAYAAVGLSYGRTIMQLAGKDLSVGATVKYIRGIAYEKITELRGGVVTLATGFSGEGTMIAQTATGGNGFSLDVGAAIKLNEQYTAGVSFSNLINSVNWNKGTEEHGYHFEFDTLTIDNMEDDSVVVSDDYTIDIPSFSANLPTVMRAGLADITGKFIWAVDYVQGFKLAAGSSSKPQIAAGIEYRLVNSLPLRAGYSVGGGKGSVMSGGLGFILSAFYLDLAVSSHSFLKFNEVKGLHMSVSTGLRF